MFLRILGLIFLACGILCAVLSVVFLVAMAIAQPGGPWMFVGAVGLILGLVVLAIGWALFKRGKPVGATPPSGSGATGRFTSDQPQWNEILGRGYTLLYQKPIKGKNGRPSLLRLSVPAATDASFTVTAETWFDRVSKRAGLAKEIHTEDPAFDDPCYVRTDWVAFAEAYFADPVGREAILDLQQLGFTEIALRDREIQANWPGFDPLTHDRPGLDTAAAARLLVLSDCLPTCEASLPAEAGRRRMWQFLLWTVLIGFALTVFSVLAFEPLSAGRLIVVSLRTILPGYLFFGWVAGWLLHGTSVSHDRWRTLMLTALVLIPLGGAGTTAAVNALADKSPPVFHSATVTDKTTHRSRNSTTYYVVCPSWADPGSTVKFSVSYTEYQQATIGRSEMHVITSAGWLGVEWICSRRLVLAPVKK